MKYTLRVPTTEQYAYIEAEFEGTMEEAVKEYQTLTKAVTGGVGLDTKEFNRVLDEYIWGSGSMAADEYAQMSLDQQSIIQVIKRSRARNQK